ncbi:class I SAM-dependent methyltransferase [Agromyces sp. MMS24-JH15]|uniref:class I SAM-dependent methyltransferase n=1 Tax=Agromyces sp. MMS24-JH15 TaxID=3243765 RepID=UPI003747A27B
MPFWLGPAAYWQPAHITTSAWLGHAPFASWLVDAMRPRTIVELGTHFGFSCFVFAEAARRLGLDTTINALDSWVGDDQAGFYGDEVYDAVHSIAERDYPGRVAMLRGWFSESRPLIADGSVDLLHIDGRHGYEDVREDFEQWRSTVRDGGIVLFHDIAERSDGFGVWRFWRELADEHPTFAFDHSHGLGVLAIGEVSDGPVGRLLTADDATAARIRADFEALAAVVEQQARFEAMPAEIASLHDVVEMLQARNEDTLAHLAARERTIDELRSSTSWRVTRPIRWIGTALHRRSHG